MSLCGFVRGEEVNGLESQAVNLWEMLETRSTENIEHGHDLFLSYGFFKYQTNVWKGKYTTSTSTCHTFESLKYFVSYDIKFLSFRGARPFADLELFISQFGFSA